MNVRKRTRSLLLLLAAASSNAFQPLAASADQLLVADRLSNAVYRYSGNGQLLGTVLTDSVNLNGPSGITISPDYSNLYVTSSGNNRVVKYDYNIATGTATNPTIFADFADGLVFPSSVLFSQDGSKLYVSNLGGSGVAQFNLDGSVAGAPINGTIGGGAFFQFAGMAYAPSGELLVAAFQDFTGNPDPNAVGTAGAVAKSNAAISSIADFVAPSPALLGASGLLVNGDNLYVTGMFAGTLMRYDANTGVVDPGFGVSGLEYPQQLLADPNGNGFLAGILGSMPGSGNITRFGFDGTALSTFASASGGGFTEATSFVWVVPEPATCGMLTFAAVTLGFTLRRRQA